MPTKKPSSAKKTSKALLLNRGTGNGGVASPKAIRTKTPNDVLASLDLAKIDTTFRREVEQRGLYLNASYALDQISRLVPPLAEVLNFWQSQISVLDWSINVLEDADPTKAERQKQIVQDRFNQFANLKRALKHLALYRFYGFSACQVLENSLAIIKPWSVFQDIQWQGTNPPSYDYYLNASGVFNPVVSGAERLVSPAYCLIESDQNILLALLRLAFSYRTQNDSWDLNLADASKNQTVVQTPPMSTLTETQKTKLEQLLIALSEGASGWVEELDVEHPIKITRMEPPPALSLYKDRLEFLKTTMLSLVCSSTLNSQTGATGLGSNVAEQHATSLQTLVLQDAGSISEALDEAITSPCLIDAGEIEEGEVPLVYFSLAQRKSSDAKGALELAKMARDAGQEIEAGELKEMTGLSLNPYSPPAQSLQSPILTNAEPSKSSASAFMSDADLQAIDKNLLKAIENLTAKYMDDEEPVDEKFIADLQEAIKKLSPELVSVDEMQKALEAEMLSSAKKAIVGKTAEVVKQKAS